MKKIIFMTLFLLVAMTGQSKGKGEFTVLQWNVWQEGTMAVSYTHLTLPTNSLV